MFLTTRFEEALVFASRLHVHQVHKGTTILYVSHLLAVAGLVLESGASEDEAIAALLHDAVEDQGGAATREEIRRRFGDSVVQIIDGCTDADVIPKPPWRERKEKYIAHIREASPSVRLVSAADKLHNARAILAHYRELGEALWDRFNGGKEGTLWYYRSLVEVFHQAGGPTLLVEELDRVVSELERLALAEHNTVEYDSSDHLDAEEMQRRLQEKQRHITLMLKTMQVANSSLDLETLLDSVAESLVTEISASYCDIYLHDWERRVMILMVTAGNVNEVCRKTMQEHKFELDPAVDTFVRQLLDERQPVICNDVQSDQRISQMTAQVWGFKSMVAVPMRAHDRIFGLIMLSSSKEHRTFTNEEIALVDGVASLVALVIENARLDNDVGWQIHQMYLLEGLFQTTHLEALWEPIRSVAQSRTDAEGSAILLLEEDWLRVAFSTSEARPSFERLPIEGTLFGDVARNIEPVLENDPDKARVYSGEAKSLLAVPLRVEGRVIGVMAVVNRRGGFELYHLSNLSHFADLAAVAIDNALLRRQVEQRTAAENL